jgi:hypothetical protein
MKIVGIGLEVSHTLVGIERKKARRTAVREVTYAGGTRLICRLIRRISSRTTDRPEIIPFNSQKVRTFAECREYPFNASDSSKRRSWRISKAVGQTQATLRPDSALNIGNCADKLLVVEIPHLAEAQPSLTKRYLVTGEESANAWAVVKTEVPDYLGSELYNSINSLYGRNHIIIMNLSTTRMMNNSPLIRSMSWESLAVAVQAALIREIEFKQLVDKLPYLVIVPIMNDGAIYFRCAQSEENHTLIYDPQSIEGEWNKSRAGHMLGATQCVAAAVAAGVIEGSATSLERYVAAGLYAARGLHETGFRLEPHSLPFPLDKISESYRSGKANNETFKSIQIPAGDRENPAGTEVNWSIVRQSLLLGRSELGKDVGWGAVQKDLFDLVRDGIDTELFRNVPVVQFGEKYKLTAVLREEIEELRAIRSLMREYSGRDSNKRPLSIAVFGWPGSGKSFAVKAVAESIPDSRREFQTLEFNLSQFSAPEQLYEALHQVRDLSLSGKMPLVFFDEFDSDFIGQYGWLRYFLAPMQDGKFTQGQISHSVGDAVFVFAGGTSHDIQTFRESAQDAKPAKGPDFLSRLQGFLNIANLNHGEERYVLLGGVLIRRAILLRGVLLKLSPGIADGQSRLDIDESVMKAFLHIREFHYSARSVESILTMSSLHEKTRFEPSCLPPVAQINLHVDGSEWLSLLEGISDSDNTSEAKDRSVISW